MTPDPYFPPFIARQHHTRQLSEFMAYVDQVRDEPRVRVTLHALHKTDEQRKRPEKESHAPSWPGIGSAPPPCIVYAGGIYAAHEVEVGQSEDETAELVPKVTMILVSPYVKCTPHPQYVPHPEICKLWNE